MGRVSRRTGEIRRTTFLIDVNRLHLEKIKTVPNKLLMKPVFRLSKQIVITQF
jgi:hypothetical protein